MTGEQSRRGRWRTGEDSRRRVLQAAQQCFAEHGYDRTTIRGIAADAGVDPAMVHYFFATKAKLFAAAMALPGDLAGNVAELLRGDHDDLGIRIVRYFLSTWDGADSFEPLFALLRSAPSDDSSAGMLREFLQREVTAQLHEVMAAPNRPVRAQLVAAHLVGLAMMRYVVRIEPLRSTPAEDIAATMGPVLQRYLD